MINILRILFIIIGAAVPLLYFSAYSATSAAIAGGCGAMFSFVLLIVIEYVSHTFSARILVAAVLGLLAGSTAGFLVSSGLAAVKFPFGPEISGIIRFAIIYFFSFAVMLFFAIKN